MHFNTSLCWGWYTSLNWLIGMKPETWLASRKKVTCGNAAYVAATTTLCQWSAAVTDGWMNRLTNSFEQKKLNWISLSNKDWVEVRFTPTASTLIMHLCLDAKYNSPFTGWDWFGPVVHYKIHLHQNVAQTCTTLIDVHLPCRNGRSYL